MWSLPELAEAAARCGRIELARATVARLAECTQAAGTELALGIEARVRALVTEAPQAEELYREAVDRLGGCRFALDLARAHLVFGEWLRREHRRVDAREQLRTAHDMFATMGAVAFAERARRELLATGETVRARTPDTRDQLTAQEMQIAQLARRRALEPHDRCAAVHQSAHGPVPPAQGVREAGHQLPDRPAAGAAQRREGRLATGRRVAGRGLAADRPPTGHSPV